MVFQGSREGLFTHLLQMFSKTNGKDRYTLLVEMAHFFTGHMYRSPLQLPMAMSWKKKKALRCNGELLEDNISCRIMQR